MHVYRKSLLGDNIFEKIGGGFMDAARGVITLSNKARGDTDDVYVPSGPSLSTVAIYGGLFAAALYVVVKK